MDLTGLTLFRMAQTKMEWASQRQKLLSQNIANADTPNFVPHDLKEIDFRSELRQVSPVKVARTNPEHHKGTIPEVEPYRAREIRKNFEASPDGNKVILEEQMQKVGDTRGQFNRAVSLMQSYSKMLKMALGKGGTSA